MAKIGNPPPPKSPHKPDDQKGKVIAFTPSAASSPSAPSAAGSGVADHMSPPVPARLAVHSLPLDTALIPLQPRAVPSVVDARGHISASALELGMKNLENPALQAVKEIFQRASAIADNGRPIAKVGAAHLKPYALAMRSFAFLLKFEIVLRARHMREALKSLPDLEKQMARLEALNKAILHNDLTVARVIDPMGEPLPLEPYDDLVKKLPRLRTAEQMVLKSDAQHGLTQMARYKAGEVHCADLSGHDLITFKLYLDHLSQYDPNHVDAALMREALANPDRHLWNYPSPKKTPTAAPEAKPAIKEPPQPKEPLLSQAAKQQIGTALLSSAAISAAITGLARHRDLYVGTLTGSIYDGHLRRRCPRKILSVH